jgi:hypothetical protein
MNVKELMEILAGMPPEMEIIVNQHSDYCCAYGATVEKAIDKDFYIMRWHEDFKDRLEVKVKDYLLIA